MIKLETHVLLRHLLEQGLSQTAIARQLGISERTIRRWIQNGELDRPIDQAVCYGPRPSRARKLDPFLELIRTRLEAYPQLSAVRLFEEIRASGYSGGYSQLAELVSQLRPRPAKTPPIRFETAPGVQAQVDFARFTFPWGVRYALLVVLGYSRLLFLRFCRRQDMATLFQGLEAAFDGFSGVPQELLFDQMKAVITRDLRLLGGQLVVNEEFLRFAAHWNFRPRACRPYRAQTKGKVERPIRYVRENFVYGRDLIDDAHLAEECARWLERANGRVHATTKQVPRLRFEEERALLRPLALRPYQSLVLPSAVDAEAVSSARQEQAHAPAGTLPRIAVEKRPLSHYATLVGGQL